MRILRLLLVGALLVFANAAPAQAQADPQGPTILYKGHNADMIYFISGAMDEPLMQIAVFSSDPQFYKSGWCEGQWPTPDDAWFDLHYVGVAIAGWMKVNDTWKTANFTRVYQLTGPGGGPFDTFDAWACSLLEGHEGPLLAEGITQWLSTERNECGLVPGRTVGPGRISWSLQAKGILSAPTYCPKAMATFDMQVRWMVAIGAVPTDGECAYDPSDIREIQVDWPCLTCIGAPAP